uniref:Uncharacterized protein n=1 Tax=Nelumbo nucifera TaxID=4432 RepID=A0A822YUT9_NELNU|nr:TPA_asm: hypothetical protein HUJ06_006910 [Nelumbo nucifera]
MSVVHWAKLQMFGSERVCFITAFSERSSKPLIPFKNESIYILRCSKNLSKQIIVQDSSVLKSTII